MVSRPKRSLFKEKEGGNPGFGIELQDVLKLSIKGVKDYVSVCLYIAKDIGLYVFWLIIIGYL